MSRRFKIVSLMTAMATVDELHVGVETLALGRLGRIVSFLERGDSGDSGRQGIAEVVPAPSPTALRVLASELMLEQSRLPQEALASSQSVCVYDQVLVDEANNRVVLSGKGGLAKSLFSAMSLSKEYVPLQAACLVVLGVLLTPFRQISLSSVFLRDGARIQLAGWFPSTGCVARLSEQADNTAARCVLQRHVPTTGASPNERVPLRAIAYVMTEMLTGTRVRASFLDDDALLSLLRAGSQEHAFVSLLLQPMTTLSDVLAHSYVRACREPSGRTMYRSLVERLLEKECVSCDEQVQIDTRDLNAWCAQFERRYQRPPTAQDLPSSVRRLQARCRVTEERRAMLRQRLRIIQQSTRAPMPESETAKMLVPADILQPRDGLPRLEIDSSNTSSVDDNKRRSPAQKAFLRHLSETESASSSASTLPDDSHSVSSPMSRDAARQLFHQRKEVMDVITSLEQDT
ncbi:hypothetical protein P43SY_001397 [Pythium insidiosum]|uniref:Uncharacterized protein n=1 Tax=Pythium insidiosum TaxID=114742 RepID=A0AAD5LK06_PYTIN|nr:hypothetical protein P43SY_001397 [Pythium insidiosum]